MCIRDRTRDWYKFSGIKANHVVDIYFKEKGAEGPVEINREDYVKITTQITGGPGEITGGAIVKKDTPYEVNWEKMCIRDRYMDQHSLQL